MSLIKGVLSEVDTSDLIDQHQKLTSIIKGTGVALQSGTERRSLEDTSVSHGKGSPRKRKSVLFLHLSLLVQTALLPVLLAAECPRVLVLSLTPFSVPLLPFPAKYGHFLFPKRQKL